ncbi:MAG: glycosyltransferase family 4 protein [Desulfobacterales bacterium]|nr:glycosyltransferase family 4 protein [Desulfobacterales bacterium]
MKKKILIVSYHFWPEQTPRAFRAYELARELLRRDHEVTVVTKKVSVDRNLDQAFNIHEFPLKYSDVDRYIPSRLLPRKTGAPEKERPGKPGKKTAGILNIALPHSLHFWKIFLWPSLWSREFAREGARRLKNKLDVEYDLTISVDSFSLPSHCLTYKLRKQGVKLGVAVGDCGDPYTFNPSHAFSVVNYLRERVILSIFKYITVPTPKAIDAFTRLGVEKSKIKIIPQGFSFEPLKSKKKIFGEDRTGKTILIYGGKFKNKIRNPENFFDALVKMKKRGKKVECHIFTDLKDSYTRHLREKYQPALGETATFHALIMRDKFLAANLEADFSLNFVNRSRYQAPSKLIDLAIVKAKIIDISMDMTPDEIVSKIEKKDYYMADLDPRFDIRSVADNFLSLGS